MKILLKSTTIIITVIVNNVKYLNINNLTHHHNLICGEYSLHLCHCLDEQDFGNCSANRVLSDSFLSANAFIESLSLS